MRRVLAALAGVVLLGELSLAQAARAEEGTLFAALIPGQELTDEELDHYSGRGVNVASITRFSEASFEVFSQTFLEVMLERLRMRTEELRAESRAAGRADPIAVLRVAAPRGLTGFRPTGIESAQSRIEALRADLRFGF